MRQMLTTELACGLVVVNIPVISVCEERRPTPTTEVLVVGWGSLPHIHL